MGGCIIFSVSVMHVVLPGDVVPIQTIQHAVKLGPGLLPVASSSGSSPEPIIATRAGELKDIEGKRWWVERNFQRVSLSPYTGFCHHLYRPYAITAIVHSPIYSTHQLPVNPLLVSSLRAMSRAIALILAPHTKRPWMPWRSKAHPNETSLI